MFQNYFKNSSGEYIFTPEIAQAWRQGNRAPIFAKKVLKIKNIPDPTKLMLAPDAGGGGGGYVQVVSGGYDILKENMVYNFVVNNNMLPNGYRVGSGMDKNLFQLNYGKPPVTINGQISGRWLKFNPTLVQLRYPITNKAGVVRITSPSNLVGYEIPLNFLRTL
jgi:hypothetical protein